MFIILNTTMHQQKFNVDFEKIINYCNGSMIMNLLIIVQPHNKLHN